MSKKKKDDRMCALIFIDGKLTLFLGSFGKLTANFGLFHFNKADVLKIPPSLYTVRRPSLKPRHWLRTRQKHTVFLIRFLFGFAVPRQNSEHARTLTSSSELVLFTLSNRLVCNRDGLHLYTVFNNKAQFCYNFLLLHSCPDTEWDWIYFRR